jgi:hypothetical protein
MGNKTLEYDYKNDHTAPVMKEQDVEANSQKSTSKRRTLFILEFYDTYTYDYI